MSYFLYKDGVYWHIYRVDNGESRIVNGFKATRIDRYHWTVQPASDPTAPVVKVLGLPGVARYIIANAPPYESEYRSWPTKELEERVTYLGGYCWGLLDCSDHMEWGADYIAHTDKIGEKRDKQRAYEHELANRRAWIRLGKNESIPKEEWPFQV